MVYYLKTMSLDSIISISVILGGCFAIIFYVIKEYVRHINQFKITVKDSVIGIDNKLADILIRLARFETVLEEIDNYTENFNTSLHEIKKEFDDHRFECFKRQSENKE